MGEGGAREEGKKAGKKRREKKDEKVEVRGNRKKKMGEKQGKKRRGGGRESCLPDSSLPQGPQAHHHPHPPPEHDPLKPPIRRPDHLDFDKIGALSPGRSSGEIL